MKRIFSTTAIAALLLAALTVMLPQAAQAGGTPACTNIGNTAYVDYKVGGVDQPQLSTGTTATFVVGNKVNLTVVTADSANVTVAPGSSGTNAALTFRVTNNGNATQRYTLSAIAFGPTTSSPFSGSDNFDASGYTVHVDTGGGYGADTSTISSLASDATATVQIRANVIPLARANGDIAVYGLKALTINTDDSAVTTVSGTGTVFDSSGAQVCTSVDVQLADADSDGAGGNDGDKDGAFLDESAFQVQSVVLTVSKTSSVIEDGFGGTKKLPGAFVEYAIRVTRTSGAGSATGIVITDTVPGNTAPTADRYNANVSEVARIKYDASNPPAATDYLNDGDADLTAWGTGTGATVTAACGAAFALDETGDYCEIKFQVQIQ